MFFSRSPRRKFSRITVFFFSSAVLLFYATFSVHGGEKEPAAPIVQNVILMIGDGMGFPHVRLTADYAKKQLTMQTLPVAGEIETRSADKAVTDSAAAGTALACGVKTNNGMLGLRPDETPVVSIAALARDAGKRVGVISSVPLNHATPAAFYAHVSSRGSYFEIGRQAFASQFAVLGGGSLSDAEGANVQPRPQTNLWKEAEAAGYRRLRTPADLESAKPGAGRFLLIPERLYAEKGLPYAKPFDPQKDVNLAQMTVASLKLLENPKGFFLMVEGGAIDWAGHANNTVSLVAEMIEFDDAVAVAKAFAEANPNTLLVVTSDHETGGLTLAGDYDAEKARALLHAQTQAGGALGNRLLKQSGEAPPQNGWEAARNVIAKTLGLSDKDCEPLRPQYEALTAAKDKQRAPTRDALVRAALQLRDQKAGISWSTNDHTTANVPVYALGPGARQFEGKMDNTQIPIRLAARMGLPPLPSAPASR